VEAGEVLRHATVRGWIPDDADEHLVEHERQHHGA
jgi:hypothetical protein